MKWIGREEINSVYVDAISIVHRKDAMKIELGQVISTESEKQQRVKIAGSFIMEPHFLKHQVLDVLKNQIKAYEKEHGVLK
jgi:hypothetical protein